MESINNGVVSPSQRIGVLTLLPKPKSPTELNYIKNWRPITLLNVDYKVFAHIIKSRFLRAIPTVISKAQAGFQHGKSTCDNLILMCLTMEHFDNNLEDQGLVMQVDLEKAFDSVGHRFLFTVLKKMGFGDYIIKLVKIAFTGCMSYINVNGYLSSPIYLLRGLHQGSPLSPILFLLIAQVLTKNLENNSSIHGLNINGVNILLSLFADDIDLFLEPSEDCISEVIHELSIFGQHSGCRANISKTKGVPLGATKMNYALMSGLANRYGPNFIDNSFKTLGINFNNSSSIQELCKINYENKMEKAHSWSKTCGEDGTFRS